MIELYKPDMYQKDIYSIDYKNQKVVRNTIYVKFDEMH